jgi:hypothetical protein
MKLQRFPKTSGTHWPCSFCSDHTYDALLQTRREFTVSDDRIDRKEVYKTNGPARTAANALSMIDSFSLAARGDVQYSYEDESARTACRYYPLHPHRYETPLPWNQNFVEMIKFRNTSLRVKFITSEIINMRRPQRYNVYEIIWLLLVLFCFCFVHFFVNAHNENGSVDFDDLFVELRIFVHSCTF